MRKLSLKDLKQPGLVHPVSERYSSGILASRLVGVGEGDDLLNLIYNRGGRRMEVNLIQKKKNLFFVW